MTDKPKSPDNAAQMADILKTMHKLQGQLKEHNDHDDAN